MDTARLQGPSLVGVLGAPAQSERALAPGTYQGRFGSFAQTWTKRWPSDGDQEKLEAILSALDKGASKAAFCRNFIVKRTRYITRCHELLGDVKPARFQTQS